LRIKNLTADIVLNENAENYATWETAPPANSWTAIGTKRNPFCGKFGGKGHTVSGIYIRKMHSSYQGLFGHSEGIILNVGVVNSYIYV